MRKTTTTKHEPLNYEALVAQWNDLGCPTDTQTLAILFADSGCMAEKNFLIRSPVSLISALFESSHLLSARTYRTIVHSQRSDVRDTARKAVLSDATMLEICGSGDCTAIHAGLGNPHVRPEFLSYLATYDLPYVRYEVAKHVNTPVVDLTMLAQDACWGVRTPVAGNPNTPPDILASLAREPHWQIRWAVAGNPKTPVETLVSLTTDEKLAVRNRVTTNPRTPTEVSALVGGDASQL